MPNPLIALQASVIEFEHDETGNMVNGVQVQFPPHATVEPRGNALYVLFTALYRRGCRPEGMVDQIASVKFDDVAPDGPTLRLECA